MSHKYTAEEAAEWMMLSDEENGITEDALELGNEDSDVIYSSSSSTIETSSSDDDIPPPPPTSIRRGTSVKRSIRTRGGRFGGRRKLVEGLPTATNPDSMAESQPHRENPPAVVQTMKITNNPRITTSNVSESWQDVPNMPPDFAFTESPGLKITLDETNQQPKDFMSLFLTEDLIHQMVTETNRYASQEIDKHGPLRRS